MSPRMARVYARAPPPSPVENAHFTTGLPSGLAQAQAQSRLRRQRLPWLDVLERESILRVQLVHAGVGVPVTPVLRVAQEARLLQQPESGPLHFVAHELLVDPVVSFDVRRTGTSDRAVVDDGVDAPGLEGGEDGLVHPRCVVLLRQDVVVDGYRVDGIQVLHVGRKGLLPLPDEMARVL